MERPDAGNRPTTLPGDLTRPTNRPGQIGGNRPNRPGQDGSGVLPNRPTTLPGDLTKPARPTNRPVTLPGQIGGNGDNWWNDNNGNWGNGNWGNGNGGNWGNGNGGNWGNGNGGNWNNNNFINNTNNNTWNNWVQNNQNNWNVNINNNYNNWGVANNWNRPGWGNGYSNWGYNNNWGYNSGLYFGDYWCGNYVRPWHNNWYNGCWSGSWCNNWYVPLATGLAGWAIGANTSNWGYSYSYSNPYYVQSAQPVYNYSQPIVIYSDSSSAVASAAAPTGTGQPAGQAAAQPAAQPTSAEQTAAKDFERAQQVFKQGDYTQALVGVESAMRLVPKDPIFHEFRALCLFALGEYQSAAAVLNSLLATAPGMDWTSMSSLYDDVDDYTKQLRRLEDHIRQKPDDAAANFVAAYHYLVLDDKDAAIDALKTVVKAQPKDLTAARLLATLEPPAPPKSAVAEKLPEGKSETGGEAPEEVEAPTTNLVGNWVAKNDQTAIELTVSEEMNFVWKASMNGQASELQGKLETSENSIAFQTEKQGSLVGQAVSQGPDKFQFILLGAPAGDEGLTFERKK